MAERAPQPFDPRAWNLFAGVALLASCIPAPSSGPSSDDAEDTSTSLSATDDDETESTASETSTDSNDDSPECRSDEDCFNGYLCDDGECVQCIVDQDCWVYSSFHVCADGWCEYEWPGEPCTNYYDPCPDFQICAYGMLGGFCEDAGTPPADCEPGLLAIPTVLEPDAPPLALSFVEIDADGRDELVIATETELLVHEHGVDVPTVTAREVPSAEVQAMVAGQFDAQPGEDLLVLVGADYHRHFADGVAGFVSASVDASPLLDPQGLLAGDFDGRSFTDVLVWGADGAVLELDGLAVPISDDDVHAAATFDASAPEPGLLLAADTSVQLFDLTGAAVDELDAVSTDALAAIGAPPERRYVSREDVGTWSYLWLWDPVTLDEASLPHPGDHYELASGDFDGDQFDELVTVGDEVTIVDAVVDGDPRAEPCVTVVDTGVDGPPTDHAIGDHDGDGDDELALSFDSDVIVIIDGE